MSENRLPRILVVDDEVRLATAIRETLSQHSYEVVVAGNAAEALKLIQPDSFEILLTDLHMPAMDGVDLLRAALAIDPNMMGIMMTGHGSIDSAVAAMKAGAHDYILKPFKLSVALAVFSRALATRRLRLENAALQQRLEARTAELEAANQELEAFSYSVSHDLRSPLRSIEGFTNVLSEELGPNQTPEIQDCVSRICRGTQRMGNLIEDLLRLAQVSRATLRRQEVDVVAVAREVASKLQSDAPTRKVAWEFGACPPAKCDPGLIRVVMENLLSNSWKYTRDEPHPRIEVGSELAPDGTAIYRVKDNGAGFDMKHAQRLFAPFQRLHPEKQFEGTGIGLATVKRIVHRHGGRIWTQAAPGQGATFYFTMSSKANFEPPDRAKVESTGP